MSPLDPIRWHSFSCKVVPEMGKDVLVSRYLEIVEEVFNLYEELRAEKNYQASDKLQALYIKTVMPMGGKH